MRVTLFFNCFSSVGLIQISPHIIAIGQCKIHHLVRFEMTLIDEVYIAHAAGCGRAEQSMLIHQILS